MILLKEKDTYIMTDNKYLVGAYERLSKEDDKKMKVHQSKVKNDY